MSLRRLSLVSLAAFVAGCAASAGESDGPVGQTEEASTVCASGATTEGVDVSSYQPNTNWQQVAASGRGFAIVKATEGTTYTDPTFHANWSGMKAAGMVRGAYHFFHPSDDPIAQADYFTGVMGALGQGDLGGALDLEVTDGVAGATVVARAKSFLQRVEQNTGKVPLIYTSPGFWDGLGGDKSGFEHYTLWIAHWGVNCPDVPSPWTTWKFWQYADNGSVPGVSGGVDHDVFNGSKAALQAFAGSTPDPGIAQVNGNDSLSLVNWESDKHAELFVKKPNGDVLHTWTHATTDTWNAPDTLDGNATCGFGSVMWPSPYSYAEVVAPLAPNGNVGHLWWVSGQGWNTFHDLGGMGLDHVSTVIWPDTHAELFALGADGAIWHDYFVFASSDWSGWTSMGGANLVTGAGVIRWQDGHVELFATDAQGAAWHNWSGNYQGGWHGWDSLGGQLASRPVPVRWADGHVEVFARGLDGHLYHTWWHANAWEPFQVIDASTKILGEPSAIVNPKGNGGVQGPEVFARREDGKVVHLWWDGMAWTDFKKLDDQAAGGDPFGWVRGDGAAEVFVIDDQGDLVKDYHDPANGWSGWAPLASGPFDACVPADQGTGGSGGGGQGGAPGTGGGPNHGSGSTGSGHGSTGTGAGQGGSGGSSSSDGDAPGHDGACSCRAAGDGNDAPSGAWMLLGLALAPLARRRRR
ncbi:MAG TPA: GH25 family lysozyme [Minicystis sp.]|nr:GH25 family lysozyme [Minicystis sp.]